MGRFNPGFYRSGVAFFKGPVHLGSLSPKSLPLRSGFTLMRPHISFWGLGPVLPLGFGFSFLTPKNPFWAFFFFSLESPFSRAYFPLVFLAPSKRVYFYPLGGVKPLFRGFFSGTSFYEAPSLGAKDFLCFEGPLGAL